MRTAGTCRHPATSVCTRSRLDPVVALRIGDTSAPRGTDRQRLVAPRAPLEWRASRSACRQRPARRTSRWHRVRVPTKREDGATFLARVFQPAQDLIVIGEPRREEGELVGRSRGHLVPRRERCERALGSGPASGHHRAAAACAADLYRKLKWRRDADSRKTWPNGDLGVAGFVSNLTARLKSKRFCRSGFPCSIQNSSVDFVNSRRRGNASLTNSVCREPSSSGRASCRTPNSGRR